MEYKKRILITGGAGFIGSHLVRHFVNKYPEYLIVVYDALTYAGDLENLKDILGKENLRVYRADIKDSLSLAAAFKKHEITDIIHLAAESHVDRSINDPNEFVTTNVIGTVNLLNIAKTAWKDNYESHRFHHVSTDEVYGSLPLGTDDKFHETTKYDPHSPYSASKASSDHFVLAYHTTYGMNVTISNCSNNYGPNQFPEKLIPLAIDRLKNGKKIPIYGTGDNVRDWLYVVDHVKAIDKIFHEGKSGRTYNVGGGKELSNVEIVKAIIWAYSDTLIKKQLLEKPNEIPLTPLKFEDVTEFVEDRKGHDKRYAISADRIKEELGWEPEMTFERGIKETVKWYIENDEWLTHISTGEYKKSLLKKLNDLYVENNLLN